MVISRHGISINCMGHIVHNMSECLRQCGLRLAFDDRNVPVKVSRLL